VQFDFHEKRLFVTHNKIKTYPSGYSHLKSWVLKGRIAADKWFDMDKRTDTVDLNGKSIIGTFFFETPREAQCIRPEPLLDTYKRRVFRRDPRWALMIPRFLQLLEGKIELSVMRA
jgi:hypothetical protein